MYDAHTDDLGKPVLDNEEDIIQVAIDINNEFPKVKFNLYRQLDTDHSDELDISQDLTIKTDIVLSMGYAIYTKEVNVFPDDIPAYTDHPRFGQFEMILHQDLTTSYWGLYANNGAMDAIYHSLTTATIVSLLAVSLY